MYPLLSGLRVIEASSFVASPTAGLYLAQMGAEVIRFDAIGGGPDSRGLVESGGKGHGRDFARSDRVHREIRPRSP